MMSRSTLISLFLIAATAVNVYALAPYIVGFILVVN